MSDPAPKSKPKPIPSHDPCNYGPVPDGAPPPGTLCYIRVKVMGYHAAWRGCPPDADVHPVSKGGLPFMVRGLCPVLVVPPDVLTPAKMAADEQALYSHESVPPPD